MDISNHLHKVPCLRACDLIDHINLLKVSNFVKVTQHINLFICPAAKSILLHVMCLKNETKVVSDIKTIRLLFKEFLS